MLRLLWAAVLGVTVLVAAGSPAVAEDDTSGALVVLPSDGVTMTPVANGSGVSGKLTVLNGSSREIAVRVSAVLNDGSGVETSPTISSDSFVLPAGRTKQTTLNATTAASGVAVVFAQDRSSGEIAGRVERPVSTEKGPATPKVASKEWTYTDGPWKTGELDGRIALSTTCDEDWHQSVTLVDPHGATLPVTITCATNALAVEYPTQPSSPSPAPSVSGTATGPATTGPPFQTGVFKGSLKLGSDTVVALTITRQQPVWIALFCLLAGVVVTLLATTWVKVTRPLRQARTALKKVGVDVVAEAKRMAEEEKAKGANGDPLVVNALNRLKSPQPLVVVIDDYLSPRWRPFITSISPAERAKLTKAVAGREGDVGQLKELPRALQELGSLLNLLPNGSAVHTRFDDLTSPSKDGWEFKGAATMAELYALITLARDYPTLVGLRDDLSTLASTAGLSEYERQAVLKTRVQLEELLDRVLTTTDAPGLVKEFPGLLRPIAATVKAVPAPERWAPRRLWKSPAHAPTTARPDGDPLQLGTLELARRLQWLGSLVTAIAGRTANLVLFSVTLVAAVMAALTTFYIDKPWGSAWDICAAVIYGATTFAAALALSTLLGEPIEFKTGEGSSS